MLLFRSWRIGARCAALLLAAGLNAASGFANPQPLPVEGPWTSGDYVSAIFAVLNGTITLPRRGNPKTEAFFDRLIDPGNIERLLAEAKPVDEKRRQILLILSTTGEFRGRYGYAVALGDDVQSELIEIQMFRLYLMGRLVSLDSTQSCCSSAIATALLGTLDTLAEARDFPAGQVITLIRRLAKAYPAIRPGLAEPQHEAIAARLDGLMASATDPALKAALAAAQAAVRRGN